MPESKPFGISEEITRLAKDPSQHPRNLDEFPGEFIPVGPNSVVPRNPPDPVAEAIAGAARDDEAEARKSANDIPRLAAEAVRNEYEAAAIAIEREIDRQGAEWLKLQAEGRQLAAAFREEGEMWFKRVYALMSRATSFQENAQQWAKTDGPMAPEKEAGQ